MSESEKQNFQSLIDLAEASKMTGYHQNYLAFLCRQKQLPSFKVGRNWLIPKSDLEEFIKIRKNGIREVEDETGSKIPVYVKSTNINEGGAQDDRDGQTVLSGEDPEKDISGQPDPSKFLSLNEVSKITGYHKDYLAFLCRTGKLQSFKIGRDWATTQASLDEFIAFHKNRNDEQQLSAGRKTEWAEEGGQAEVPVTENAASPDFARQNAAEAKPMHSGEEYYRLGSAYLNDESPLSSVELNAAGKLNGLKSEVFESLNSRISILGKSLDELETKLAESRKLAQQTAVPGSQPADPGKPVVEVAQVFGEELKNKFASNFDFSGAGGLFRGSAEPRKERNLFKKDGVQRLLESFKIKPDIGKKVVAVCSVIAAVGLAASVGVSYLLQNPSNGGSSTIIYAGRNQPKTEAPTAGAGFECSDNNCQIVTNQYITRQNITKVLGQDAEQIYSLIDQRLSLYVAEGKFKGEQGIQGTQGPAGAGGLSYTGAPAAPVGIIPSNPASGFSGGTIMGVTVFSADTGDINTIKTANLTVKNSASFSGPAVFSGPVEFNSTATLASLSSGSINPGFASGSIVFQRGGALAEDNGNFFYDQANKRLGIGTSTPSASLAVVASSTSSPVFIASQAGETFFAINSYGNIGVGTATPDQKFTVAGNAYITGALYDSNNSPGFSGQILSSTGAGTAWFSTTTISTALGAFLQGGNSFGGTAILGTTDNQNLAFETNGVTRLIISKTGYVGVGTSSPSAMLAVTGTSTVPLLSLMSSTSAQSLFVANNGNVGIGTIGPTSSLDVNGDINLATNLRINTLAVLTSSGGLTKVGSYYNSSQLAFYGGAAERIRIDNNGNVGIGTTSPGSRLVVQGVDSTSGNSALNVLNSSGNSMFKINNDITGSFGTAANQGAFTFNGGLTSTAGVSSPYFGNDLNNQYIQINNGYHFYTSNTEKVTILNNGNVGIGNTSPSVKLQVGLGTGGNLKVSGVDNGTVDLNYNGESRVVLAENAGNAFSVGGNYGGIKLGSTGGGGYGYILGNGTSLLLNPTAGNVGIGTTGPTSRLYVQDDTSVTAEFHRTSASSQTRIVISNPSATWYMGLDDGTNFGIRGDNLPFTINKSAPSASLAINSLGNVGIGTTGPGQKLDVVGNAQITPSGTLGLLFDANGTNNRMFSSGPIDIQSNNGTLGGTGVRIRKASSQASDEVFGVYTNGYAAGNNLLTVQQSGNVGIGTTSPVGKLTVAASDTSGVTDILVNPGTKSSGNFLDLQVNGASVFNITNNGTAVGSNFTAGGSVNSGNGRVTLGPGLSNSANGAIYSTSGKSLEIMSDATAGRGMVIQTGSGNVGIGTTSPGALLHVYKSSGDVYQYLDTAGASNDAYTFVRNGSTSWTYGLAGSNNNFTIARAQGLGGTNAYLNITTAGNVGIGTTSPGTKLDVNGDVTLEGSGKLYFGTVGSWNNGAFLTRNGNNLQIRMGDNGANSALLASGVSLANTQIDYYQNGITLKDTVPLGWSTSLSSVGDIGLSRGAAGKLYVGNGTAGDYTGTLIAGNVGIGTTSPTGLLSIQGTSGNLIDVYNGATSEFRVTSGGAVTANSQITGSTFRSGNGGSASSVAYGTVIGTAGNTGMFFPGTNLLGFSTAGVEAMRIDNNGNVGIGTTSPSQLLTVGNNNQFTADNSGNVKVAGDSSSFKVQNASGGTVMLNVNTGNGTVALGGISLPSANQTALGAGGTEAIRILNNGNVGIGTTSPGTKLEVYGGNAVIGITGTGIPGLRLYPDGGRDWRIEQGRSATGQLDFTDTSASLTPRMSISTNGNVGIGTTGPVNQLQIGNQIGTTAGYSISASGGGAYSGFIVLQNTSASGFEGQNMYDNNGVLGASFAYGNSGAVSPYANNLVIGTRKIGGQTVLISGAGVEAMRIDTSGNVGIGTTSPATLLDVNGTTTLRNTLNLSDNGFVFSNENTTGVSRPGNGRLKFTVGGINSFEARSAGLLITTNNLLDANGGNVLSFSQNGSASANNINITDAAIGNAPVLGVAGSDTNINLNITPKGTGNVIITNGNVGIGTTSPQAPLEVSSSLSGGSALVNLRNTGTGADNRILFNLYSNATLWADWGAEGQGSNGALTDMYFRTKTSAPILFMTNNSASPQLVLQSGGNMGIGGAITNNTSLVGASMVINNGNVGIGTTGPSSKLDVEGGYLSLDQNYGLRFWTGTVNQGVIKPDASGNMTFSTFGAGQVLTLSNTSQGNVGIGTTGPGEKLHVVGEAIKIEDSFPKIRSTANNLTLFTSTTQPRVQIGNGYMSLFGAEAVETLRLGANSMQVYTAGSEKVRIDINGNVGIGTTAPGQALDVKGNIKAFGATTAGDYVMLSPEGSPTITLFDTGNANMSLSNVAGTFNLINEGNTQLSIDSSGNLTERGYVVAPSVIAKSAAASAPYFRWWETSVAYRGVLGYAAGSGDLVYRQGATSMADGTEQFRITSTGNVGIGTTGPGEKLHVVGEAIKIEDSFPKIRSTANNLTLFTSTTQPRVQIGNGYMSLFGAEAVETLRLGANSMQVYTAGSEKVRIDINGNVGIGTTSPATKLTIQASAGADVLNIASSTGSSMLYFDKNGNLGVGTASPGVRIDVRGAISAGGSTANSASYGYLQSKGTNGGFGVWLESASDDSALTIIPGNVHIIRSDYYSTGSTRPIAFNMGASEKVRIDTNGNVGIGTSNPSSLLTLKGSGELEHLEGAAGTATYSKYYNGGGVLAIGVDSSAGGNMVGGDTGYSSFISAQNATNLVLATGDVTRIMILSNGNVGIGTSSPSQKLSIGSAASGGNVKIANGWLCVDNNDTCTGAATAGTIYATNGTVSGGADVAENYPTQEDSLEAGDVVSADPGFPVHVSKGKEFSAVLGVVSTKPGVLLGNNTDYQNASTVPVALAGRVPVKVTNENGPIKIGDYLTVSKLFPGYAMKATEPGQVFGRALESFSSATQNDQGKILVFIQFTYYQPTVAEMLQNGQSAGNSELTDWLASLTDISQTQASAFGDVVVTGSVAIQKDLTVKGVVYAAELRTDLVTAKKIDTDELNAQKICIKDLCIGYDELKIILEKNNSAASQSQPPTPAAPATQPSDSSQQGEVAGTSTPASEPSAETSPAVTADPAASETASPAASAPVPGAAEPDPAAASAP